MASGPANCSTCIAASLLSTCLLQASSSISAMTAMIGTLQFEWSPFKHPHRLSSDAAFRSQRYCRWGWGGYRRACRQLLPGSTW